MDEFTRGGLKLVINASVGRSTTLQKYRKLLSPRERLHVVFNVERK